jgi:NAD(P)-dependent dehydrogenase (short-subunit alcohol dehydrogenase family)
MIVEHRSLETLMTQATPDPALHGARALVTGGTRGIGAAIVRHLAEAGAQVVTAARQPGDATLPGRFVQADLSTTDGARDLAEAARAALGGIDILVNNVGSQTRRPEGVLGLSDDDWQRDLSGSLLSAVRLDREVVPGMIEQGAGAVIHMGSGAARMPQPAAIAYAAAKAALATYSKGLANQVGRHGIRVNLVSPGIIETSALADRLQDLADADGVDVGVARKRFSAGFAIPLGRIGDVDDVAQLVTFLVSPRSGYLSGTQHIIDGGLLPTVL